MKFLVLQVNITKEQLDELSFFSPHEEEFNKDTLDNLLNNQSLMLLLKVHVTVEIEDIDDVILNMVYGEMRRPPGDSECLYELLFETVMDESNDESKQLAGIINKPLTENNSCLEFDITNISST